MGAGPVIVPEEERRAYQGTDRGFIFFENEPGVPWRALTDVEESEDGYSVESYYIDGKKIGQRHYKGNYHAKITSLDDPFAYISNPEDIYGLSYRENYLLNHEEHYRLHIVHSVSIRFLAAIKETVNVENPEATTFSWEADSLDTPLKENVVGSHIILDSSMIFPWTLRDIENILYDEGRIPSIDEMFEIFSLMNLLIIDHGDGTWSAIGHESMVAMIDVTEFQIVAPTIEFLDPEEQTYDIYDYIRDSRWLE